MTDVLKSMVKVWSDLGYEILFLLTDETMGSGVGSCKISWTVFIDNLPIIWLLVVFNISRVNFSPI